MDSQTAVIVVAGGSGKRMQQALPKQFLELQGLPVLFYTLRNIHEMAPAAQIVLVLPAAHIDYWKQLIASHGFAVPHRITEGGSTRFESVKNGLELCKEAKHIAVHDGVRPFVKASMFAACFHQCQTSGACIPVLSPVDSIRKRTFNGSEPVNREDFLLVQTPQIFESSLIRNAYKQDFKEFFTDDASVVEAYGHAVSTCPGNRENIKITTPFDLLLAEGILKTFSIRD
jgi:2-C-methyl-D-erythritol 4-phosphate cytidylyltransferase